MHPFWAVRRPPPKTLKKGEDYNCEERIIEYPVVIVCPNISDPGGKRQHSWFVRVPYLFNTVSLPKGAELLCEMEAPNKKDTKKERTWKDDVKLSKKAREGDRPTYVCGRKCPLRSPQSRGTSSTVGDSAAGDSAVGDSAVAETGRQANRIMD